MTGHKGRNGVANPQAFVVLCTSFAEAVDRHFHDDGPLYRRRTRVLRLDPTTYRDSALFFPSWLREDRVRAWGVVGGVPSYLQALRGATLDEAVRDNILEQSGFTREVEAARGADLQLFALDELLP